MIFLNQAKTPDGTILTSTHRHDYVDHKDLNDKVYAVDGGTDYLRRAGDYNDLIELSVTSDSPFEQQRAASFWGTYGTDGRQPLKRVAPKDMSNTHLEAVISTLSSSTDKALIELFTTELNCRKLRAVFPNLYDEYVSIED